ncbi:MAG: flagellar filament capping protein FliD [Kofleriaceae bacterium]
MTWGRLGVAADDRRSAQRVGHRRRRRGPVRRRRDSSRSPRRRPAAGAATFVDGGDGLDLAPPREPAHRRAGRAGQHRRGRGHPQQQRDRRRPGRDHADPAPPHLTGEPDASVGVQLDREAAVGQLTELVDAYNGVAALLSNQLRYDGTTKSGATLFGDSTLRRLQGALSLTITSAHGDHTLGALGVSLDRAGKMSLDEAKLTAALDADPDAVGTLFVDGGLAATMIAACDDYLRAGDGMLAGKTKALTDRQAIYQRQIDRMEASAESLRARLEAQFAAMEQTLSAWQSQATYITNAFG